MTLTRSEQARNESYDSEQPHAEGKRQAVLEFVRARGSFGATREEIAGGTGLVLSCVCGRVRELLDAGRLAESDQRRTGSSGKSHSVVIAPEEQSNACGFKSAAVGSRREQPNGETNRSSGPGDSRQQGQGISSGTGGKVQDHARNRVVDPRPKVLGALEAERIAAAVQFVTDERRPIEPWRVGVEIMNLRSRGVLAWPAGTGDEWVAAVESAVKQGLLMLKDGKVRLPIVEVQKKVVQQKLF